MTSARDTKSAAAKRSSATSPARAVSRAKLTPDDIRHKALAIRDMTTDEARRAVKTNAVRIVIGAAVVGAVALSVAYYFGSRAGARARARRR